MRVIFRQLPYSAKRMMRGASNRLAIFLAGVCAAALLAALAGFGLRGLAIARGWSLPAYRR